MSRVGKVPKPIALSIAEYSGAIDLSQWLATPAEAH
jgi:hypothetical protein